MPGKEDLEEHWKRRSTFAWLALALDLLLAGAYVFFALRNGGGRFDWSSLAFAIMPITAAVILDRQPRNRAGLAIALMGLFFILSNATGEYAYYTLVAYPGSLPQGELMSWLSAWTWLVADPLVVVVILLFPDGSPPSRRWWWVIVLIFAASLPIIIYSMVLFWPIRGVKLISPDIQSALGPVWQNFIRIFGAWQVIYMICLVLAVVGIAVRFARSSGIVRQQLKLIFLALSIVPVAIGSEFLIPANATGPLQIAVHALNLISVLGLPLAMIFAVTRYHLYDIDVIIRRTLLYSALTLTLALLYFGSVILLQSFMGRLNGAHSPVSIVLSTLLIAALFSPLRGRFQKIIDRRFYRNSYNSEQVLERFTARLRTEVDLEAINQNLLRMVEESLEPDFSALWLVERGLKKR